MQMSDPNCILLYYAVKDIIDLTDRTETQW